MVEMCITRLPGCCEAIEAGEESTDCKVADQITNSLIVTEHQASSVGRAVLDDKGYDWRMLQASCSLYENIKPKAIAEVRDKRHGLYRARISGFQLKIQRGVGNNFSARTTVQMKKVK